MTEHNQAPFTRNLLFEPEMCENNHSFSLRTAKCSWVILKSDYHYPLHEHDTYELIIPNKKTYNCRVNGCKLKIAPGHLIIVQPHDKHEDFFKADEEVFFFRFTLFDAYGNIWKPGIWRLNLPAESRILDIQPNSISAKMFDIILEQKYENLGEVFSFEKQSEALFWQIISTTSGDRLSVQFMERMGHNIFQKQVLEYFDMHLHEKLDVDKMAQKLNMSKRSFQYKFSKIFDSSPVGSFTVYKIKKAAQALAFGISVKCVADQFGFSDQFYFSTVFKKIMGYPPSQVIMKKDLH